MNVHAGLLVEACCAGQAARVDPQSSANLAAPFELGEGMEKQRKSKTALALRTSNGQHPNPSHVGILIAGLSA
jgi:hypothetical protein